MSGPLDPLSERGQRMVGSLATYEQSDPSVIAVMRSGADELDAIEDLMETVRTQAWPHLADDTYGLLSIHEAMVSLPVARAGVPVPTRQLAVKAAWQSRRVGSARRWVARMETIMNGAPWSYARNTPGPGQLTITIPYASTGYSAAQVQRLAERITPAHLVIVMRYTGGWLAGISRAGADAI